MRTLQGWSSWGGEEARWEWERLSQMDESESFYIRCSSVNSFFRPNTYSASTYVYQNKCKWYSTHNLLSCARPRVSKRVMEVLLFIPSYSTYLTVWKSSDWKLWGNVLIINTLYIYLTPPRDLSPPIPNYIQSKVLHPFWRDGSPCWQPGLYRTSFLCSFKLWIFLCVQF